MYGQLLRSRDLRAFALISPGKRENISITRFSRDENGIFQIQSPVVFSSAYSRALYARVLMEVTDSQLAICAGYGNSVKQFLLRGKNVRACSCTFRSLKEMMPDSVTKDEKVSNMVFHLPSKALAQVIFHCQSDLLEYYDLQVEFDEVARSVMPCHLLTIPISTQQKDIAESMGIQYGGASLGWYIDLYETVTLPDLSKWFPKNAMEELQGKVNTWRNFLGPHLDKMHSCQNSLKTNLIEAINKVVAS